jgi:serine/threonine protein kinase
MQAAELGRRNHTGLGHATSACCSTGLLPLLPPCPPQVIPRLADDAAALNLLSRMLTYDPAQRITAQQVGRQPRRVTWHANVLH